MTRLRATGSAPAPQWRYSGPPTATTRRPELRWLRRFWITLASIVLAALVVEASSAAFLALYRSVRPNVDDGRTADTYGGAPWVEAYYRELSAASALEWRPYVYFRRVPFSGEFVNVDADGHRRTSSVPTPSDATVTIYAFGGSTMWGTGARDDFTIPSILARLLSERFGVAARIVNFGETAYVSTQEVIALEEALRDGGEPDVVIFYDGFNDLFSAYQQGAAGMPQNEFNRAREFNLLRADRRADLVRALFGPTGLRESATFELFGILLNRIRADDQSTRPRATPIPDPLVRDTVSTYRTNVRTVEALGTRHGFSSLFYWQPTIFDKSTLTTYEERKAAEFSFVREMVDRTGAAIEEDPYLSAHPNFADLRQLFARTSAPIFTDYAHLGETGNIMIAERMLPDVVKAIRR